MDFAKGEALNVFMDTSLSSLRIVAFRRSNIVSGSLHPSTCHVKVSLLSNCITVQLFFPPKPWALIANHASPCLFSSVTSMSTSTSCVPLILVLLLKTSFRAERNTSRRRHETLPPHTNHIPCFQSSSKVRNLVPR
jgi:hypothetical protein